MSWKPEVDEIKARRAAAKSMGGPEAVELQHERGRLTVRERIAALVDPNSLEEQAPIAGETETDENGEEKKEKAGEGETAEDNPPEPEEPKGSEEKKND